MELVDMEYSVGQGINVKSSLSDDDIMAFAKLTGDMNPIHTNPLYASETVFGKPIAHGILVVGLISKAIGMDFPGVGTIYMEQDTRFLKPVFPNDELTVSIVVEDIINADKKILRLRTKVCNQDNVDVIDGFAIVKAP
jgi:3-hydroxybutyryl-CoA dehydratase